jgi:hypothetical protein
MRLLLVSGLASVGAALVLASASAVPPAPHLVSIAATHEEPLAGRSFTGITITSNPGTQIIDAHCSARAGRKLLRGRLQRFYASTVSGPAAVACSWQMPANGSGKILRATAYVLTAQEPNGFSRSAPFSWRIKP